MKSNLICCLLFIIFNFVDQAQSQEIKEIKQKSKGQIIFNEWVYENNYYYILYNPNVIFKLDPAFNVVAEKKFTMSSNSEYWGRKYYLNDGIVVLTCAFRDGSVHGDFDYFPLSDIAGKQIKVFEINCRQIKSKYIKSFTKISNDRSKFLMAALFKDKSDYYKLYFYVLDQTMELLYTQVDSVLRYPSGNFEEELTFTNGGDIYFFDQEIQKINGKKQCNMYLHSINSQGVLKNAFSIPDKFVSTSRLYDFNNQKLAFGFYSKQLDKGHEGLFVMKLSDENLIPVIIPLEFEKDDRIAINEKSSIHPEKYLLPKDFRIQEVVETETDNFTIIAENITSMSVGSIEAGTNTSIGVNLDLLVMKVNLDGKLHWTTFIPKYQLHNKTSMGIYLLKNHSEVSIILNDSPENDLLFKEGKLLKRYDGVSENSLFMYRISNEGVITRKNLGKPFGNPSRSVYINSIKEVDSNELILLNGDCHPKGNWGFVIGKFKYAD